MFATAVIERELRVRSRRPGLVWLRVGIGMAASLLALLNLNWANRGFGAAATGKPMFVALAWMAFAFCVLEGARAAADAISHEKREGTLGFLILTKLSGFEVALGKFAGVSIPSFCALLAFFPAMALALPAGGLTVGEFWRTQAALLNTLFLAVAAGLWVSSRSQDATRALLGTIGLLATIVIVPAIANPPAIFSLPPGTSGWPNVSPGVLLSSAEATHYAVSPGQFWIALLSVHGFAWALLLLAGRNISRDWRPEPSSTVPANGHGENEETAGYAIPAPLHNGGATAARTLLEEHPVQWLIWRRPPNVALLWISVMLSPFFHLTYTYLLLRFSPMGGAATVMAAFLGVSVASHLILAIATSRRWVTDRESGVLEALLASPLSTREIVLGYWSGIWWPLRRPLLVAAIAFLLVQGIGLGSGVTRALPLLQWLVQILGVLGFVVSFGAVGWLALWLSARDRSVGRVAALTVLWTSLFPYVLQQILSGVMVRLLPMASQGPFSNWGYVLGLIHVSVGLAYYLAVIVWARRQLLTRLRNGLSEPRGGLFRDFFHRGFGVAAKPAVL